jgi:hypothetical protein
MTVSPDRTHSATLRAPAPHRWIIVTRADFFLSRLARLSVKRLQKDNRCWLLHRVHKTGEGAIRLKPWRWEPLISTIRFAAAALDRRNREAEAFRQLQEIAGLRELAVRSRTGLRICAYVPSFVDDDRLTDTSLNGVVGACFIVSPIYRII